MVPKTLVSAVGVDSEALESPGTTQASMVINESRAKKRVLRFFIVFFLSIMK